MNLKRVVHDDLAWPDAIHQFLFCDEFAFRLGQNFDDLKSASTHRRGRAKNPKFAAGEINLALA